MVGIVSLLLPIVLSAAAVFIVSSILHMLVGYHNSDFKKIPSEDAVMNDLGNLNIPPGDYSIPYAATNKERNTPEYQEKMKRGPIVIMTIFGPKQMNFGSSLAQWFIYSIIVGIFAAYVAGRAVPPGTDYLSVFRFAGVTAFVGYSLALMQNSIWWKKSWSATIKSMFDGLIYALVTAGIFGWLWPGA